MNIRPDYIKVVFFLFLLGFAAYGNSLRNDFVWDDRVYILESDAVQNPVKFFEAFKDPVGTSREGGENLDISRPLMALSLLVDYTVWGENPFGYHLTNLLLHTLNAVLVFFFANLLRYSRPVALLAAVIFAIHPVHAEAVDVITFREDLLALFFILLSFISYLRGCERGERKRRFDWFMSSLFFIFAIMSKEMAITLPAAILFFHWLVVSKGRLAALRSKDFLIFMSLMAIICAAYLTGIYIVYSSLPESFYSGYPAGSFVASLMTVPLVVSYYIKLFFLPVSLLADYSFPVASSLASPIFFVPLTLLLLMVYSARVMSIRERFLLVWFAISLLPVINLVPTFNLLAERFLYIPSVSLTILFSAIICKGLGLVAGRRRYAYLCFLFSLCILFFIGLVERNAVWKNDMLLWTDTLKKNGSSFIAYNNLGNYYRRDGKLQKAATAYREAVLIEPVNAKIHFNLGNVYMDSGQPERALTQFLAARSVEPGNVQYIVNVGGLYGILGDHNRAAKAFREALKVDPGNSRARANLRIAEKAMRGIPGGL